MGGGASYTFLLRILHAKKGGGEVQKACKNAYVINGRALCLCHFGVKAAIVHKGTMKLSVEEIAMLLCCFLRSRCRMGMDV